MKDGAGREVPAHHVQLLEAFRSISGEAREALGWAALDTKFERFVTAALAVAINRAAGKRIAHIEFSSGRRRIPDGPKESRIDLVILEDRLPSRSKRHLDPKAGRIRMRYEAKAGQRFDFAPEMKTNPAYLGAELNSDLAGATRGGGAGVFFLSAIADPTRFLKPYYVGHDCTVPDARACLERHRPRGELVAEERMDCGTLDGTGVEIHMFVFDPRPLEA